MFLQLNTMILNFFYWNNYSKNETKIAARFRPIFGSEQSEKRWQAKPSWKSFSSSYGYRLGLITSNYTYRKVGSSNTSGLEAHAGFFKLLLKGIFDPHVLWPFPKKLIF